MVELDHPFTGAAAVTPDDSEQVRSELLDSLVDAEEKKDRDIVTDSVIRECALGYDNIGVAVQCVHSDAEKYLKKYRQNGQCCQCQLVIKR